MSGKAAAIPLPGLPAADAWTSVLDLPCQLTVEVPVPGFKVRDLLYLAADAVVETGCKPSSHVPVRVNGQLIAMAEFEVIGETLAVRLTELT